MQMEMAGMEYSDSVMMEKTKTTSFAEGLVNLAGSCIYVFPPKSI